MNQKEKDKLTEISLSDTLKVGSLLRNYLDTVTISEEETEVSKGTRTPTQNDSIWLFLGIFADKCVEMNISMRKIYEMTQQFDVPVTKERAHDVWIWFQKNLFHTERTRDLKKIGQVDRVHEVMMKNMGEIFHMEYIDFPSKKNPMTNVKLAQHNNLTNEEYPEQDESNLADKF